MKLSPFLDHIIALIQEKTNQPVIFRHIHPEHGGSINESFKIETSAGNFFLKKNDAIVYPGMFEKEAKGLESLSRTETLHIPEVITFGQFESEQFLILRHVEKGLPSSTFWEDFGRGLAQMHQYSGNRYGWKENNYIGSLVQINTEKSNWVEFFIENRLQPMVEMAVQHKKINRSQEDLFQNLYKKIGDIFPIEKPTLLHGDFWNGNFMPNSDGRPMIYDPAVYYGHREMDIAMSQLFGGFHQKFYDAYNELAPIEKGWKDRVRLANLYPLMVHVNLFGGSYLGEVDATLKAFQ